MRRLALVITLTASSAFAAKTPKAAPPTTMQALARFTKNPKLLWRKGRFDWNVHPEKRKQLVGKGALMVAGVGVSYGVDTALVHFGAPPLAAGFVSNGLPVVAQHVAQGPLHEAAPSYFEAPPYRDKPWTLTLAAASSGIAGTLGTWGVDKVFSSVQSSMSASIGGRYGGQALTQGVLWGIKKLGGQGASDLIQEKITDPAAAALAKETSDKK